MNHPVISKPVEEKSHVDSFLRFQEISCTYGSVRGGTVTALSDVNLSIRRGEFVVILGPSGSGKSTMLRLANGMTMAASGGIVFDGIDLTPEHLPRIRPRIGTIHQQFHLVGRSTVIRNVLCGILPRLSIHRSLSGWFPQPARKKAAELLGKVGLDESHFFRPARSLSGGQQQRAAIARAFMLDPELILADEPVASLDPPTGREILALLRTFARENGTTVLCSLHQIEMALEFADRLIGLNGGKIVFDGRPGEIDAAAIENVMGKIYEGAAGASPSATIRRDDLDHMSEARLA